MTADLLRRQLQILCAPLPDGERTQAFEAMLKGAETALYRAHVIGVEGRSESWMRLLAERLKPMRLPRVVRLWRFTTSILSACHSCWAASRLTICC